MKKRRYNISTFCACGCNKWEEDFHAGIGKHYHCKDCGEIKDRTPEKDMKAFRAFEWFIDKIVK